MLWPALILFAFLCGSIPFGLLLARARGIDIRAHGSGNIGATNVARILGKKLGLLCFALDVLKGFGPTFSAGLIAGLVPGRILAGPIDTAAAWLWLTVMAAAVMGHMFSPWIGFRGGKGVATGLGAMLGIFPYLTIPALACLAVWIIMASIWRYVSLASCAAALALPLLVLGWGAVSLRLASPSPEQLLPVGFWPFIAATAALAALVVVKHRANIRRLLAGTESRIGGGAPAAR